MNREEHYTDGRRWSYISNAWILLSSWNDREELATMTAAAESVRQENVRLRAEIERLQAIISAVNKDGLTDAVMNAVIERDHLQAQLATAKEHL